MPDTWKCTQCQTVNHRHDGRCMACSSARATSTASEGPDLPATKVVRIDTGTTPDTPAAPAAPVRPVTPAAASPRTGASTTTPYSGTPAYSSAAPATPAYRSATPATPKPAAPAPKTPAYPPSPASSASSPDYSRGRRNRGPARRFATGKLLGIGHIGLLMIAILDALFTFSWGRPVVTWGFHQSIALDVAGWSSNRVISDSSEWLTHLPGSTSTTFYFVLAGACILMRLIKALPGWISLPIGLIAAVYGVLTGVSALASFAIYWPLALGALIISWIFVGKTVR
jgi:hypothetical protein